MKKLIIQTISLLLPALLKILRATFKPKKSTADKSKKIMQALRDKIRSTVIVVFLLLPVLGCNRTIYVPEGAPCQLRETVKSVKVWVKVDGEWEKGVIDLHEGWYCAQLSEEEINNTED